MPVTGPDWLTKHGGNLRISADERRYVVYFANEPQYTIEVIPAGGKFGVRILQTISGRRVECAGTHATMNEAVAGGLEGLRKALGW